jgi:acetyltransferase-like isoleucine patch superfamily enzyme
MHAKPVPTVLYGSRGYAAGLRDILLYSFSEPLVDVVAYVDDIAGDTGIDVDGVPVVAFDTWRERYAAFPVFVTLGNPVARRRIAERVAAAGGVFSDFRDRTTSLPASCRMGSGTLVAQLVSIGRCVTFGAHTQVMPFVSIAAGCTVGDFVMIAQSATIGPGVTIEDGAWIGIGSTIVAETPGATLRIGSGARVSAGAVVTRSVPAGSRVFGNPAVDARSAVAARRGART